MAEAAPTGSDEAPTGSEETPIGRGAVVRRPRRQSRDALGYEPSLDGLRAVAVTAVLVYHARFSWAPGGFLGVSTFFTLSGFLITSLMLREWHEQGGISLRRFFSRRFRRLLPASWFTLNLVVVMGALGIWSTDQLRALRGDVPWALAELINWHFIWSGRAYGAQFVAPSPLEHFWSLAVEEQFYLLMPLVVAGMLAWGARRAARRGANRVGGGHNQAPLVVVLAVAGVVSLVLNGVLARNSIPRAYFGTETRLAELVAGALLACVGLRRIRMGGRGRRLLLQAVALVAFAVMLVLWNTATVTASWLYPWGFMVTAAASTALIVGALQRGAVTRVLALAPLVALGRISYGVYLLHWPVFLWLTPARVGWSQWPLFGLRMTVTLVAAVAMFRLLETPIRTGARLRGRVAARAALPVVVVILVCTALVTSDLPAPSELAAAGATTTVPAPPAPVRVLVVGDELASSWSTAPTGTRKVPLEVTSASAPACGVALGGWVRVADGSAERDTDRCGPVKDAWVAKATELRPDVVVVWSALRDVADRRVDLESPWQAPGQPQLDDFLSTETKELVSRLEGSGAAVLVASAPHMRNATPPPPPAPPILPADKTRADLVTAQGAKAAEGVPPAGFAENDNARIDRWNQLLAAAAGERGFGYLDLAKDMAAWPGGEFDPQRRAADGVGLTEIGITELADGVAPQLKAARPAAPPADAAATVAANVPLPEAPPVTPRRTVPAGKTADVLVVGDSVAFNIGFGLTAWAKGGAEARVQSAGQLGCPIARGGQYRFLRDINAFEPRCEWADMFPRFISERDPAVVVLTSGIWEVVDRRLAGDDRFRHIGQPEIDRYILREFLAAIDTLSSKGASVVLLTYPHFEAGRDQGYTDLPESDPARVDRLNQLMAEAVSLRPGVATLVDFQSWLAAQPGGELDPAKREDGLHFYDSFSPTIGAWLGPQVLDIARNGIPAPPPTTAPPTTAVPPTAAPPTAAVPPTTKGK